MQIKNKTIKIH